MSTFCSGVAFLLSAKFFSCLFSDAECVVLEAANTDYQYTWKFDVSDDFSWDTVENLQCVLVEDAREQIRSPKEWGTELVLREMMADLVLHVVGGKSISSFTSVLFDGTWTSEDSWCELMIDEHRYSGEVLQKLWDSDCRAWLPSQWPNPNEAT